MIHIVITGWGEKGFTFLIFNEKGKIIASGTGKKIGKSNRYLITVNKKDIPPFKEFLTKHTARRRLQARLENFLL